MPNMFLSATQNSSRTLGTIDVSEMQSARGTQLTIPITLTSVKNPLDSRRLTVTEGERFTIGRASRSEAKDLQARPTNALFDCPVVSRIHAQLRVESSKLAVSHVSITDMGSMHGTVVNSKRIPSHVPFPLVNGDQIKFGDKVTRGSGMTSYPHVKPQLPSRTKLDCADIHDGVWVIFRQAATSYTQPTQTMRSASSGFRVPSDSEDESEQDSDNDSCVETVPGLCSSAMTTPEQAKSTIKDTKSSSGTQEQPINIDADQLEVEIIKAPEQQKEVPDTFAESMDESTDVHAFSWSDDEDEQSIAEEEMDDDDESVDVDEEHEEILSESDASDLSNHYDESDADGPEVMSSKKEASPELGTPADAVKDTNSWYRPSQMHPTPAPKPSIPGRTAAYDPIRGSLPQSVNSFWAPPAPIAKPYSYAAVRGTSNLWDTEPRTESMFKAHSASLGQPSTTIGGHAYYTPYNSYTPNAGNFSGFPPSHSPPALVSPISYPYGTLPTSSITGTTDDSRQGLEMLRMASVAAKSRISIPNIVDDSSSPSLKPALTEDVAQSSKSAPSRGVAVDHTLLKRKASALSEDAVDTSNQAWIEADDAMQSARNDTMSAFPQPEISAQFISEIASANGATQEQSALVASQPVAKKARTIKSVGWEATKYASAALFGGVGTVAFLASPLAAKLLESL